MFMSKDRFNEIASKYNNSSAPDSDISKSLAFIHELLGAEIDGTQRFIEDLNKKKSSRLAKLS